MSFEGSLERCTAEELAANGPWHLLRPYRSRVLAACIMLLCTAGLTLSLPKVLGNTIEALIGPDPEGQVPPLAMWMIGIAIVGAGTRIASRVLLFNAARMAEYDLRSIVFRHLLGLDSGYYRENTTGDVMSRLTNDVQTVRALWGPGLLNIVNTSFLVTVALVLMLQVDPVLTAWALLPYPSMVILGLGFGKRIYKSSRQVQAHLGALSSSIQEDLTGISIIKSYNLEENRAENFAKSSTALLHHNMALTKVRGQLVPTLGAVAALGTVVMLFVGGRRVIEGHITLGQLIEFNAYLAALVWPTLAMGWMISLLQRGRASWERLAVVLETKPQIADGESPALAPESTRGDVEIRNLSLSLGEREILSDISLRLAPGTTTAIVGRTGSGKSTLISALPRLNGVSDGQIFLDGHDINTLPLESLRSLIGFAPQEAFLFSTSIGENIRFGVDRRPLPPNTEAGYQGAIEEAARYAGLSRELIALPDGLDTVVGERGITLSGGQRQRVALARALATQPKVLVLDDSLSSVDAETEREILTHLGELMKDRTSIILSHRLAAVRSADQIAVLEGGKLVELGKHEELLAKAGVYAEIYDTQLREGVLVE
ncbi:MAG: ABC transporter ATP-binding protein [Myxococcales bacterium]|nr:ABC transporter ATP-binding protein [Myxococcales bacterium]